MALTFTGRIAAADALLDTDLRDLEIVSTGQGSFLYAATGQNGGITAYQLQEGGLAGLAGSTYFTVSGMGVGRFEAVMLDGRAQLILDGAGAGRMLRFQPGEDGSPGRAGTIDLPGQGGETHAVLAAQSLTGGVSALYTVDAETGGLGGWISNGTGKLVAAAARKGGTAGFALDGAVALETANMGRESFLLAADAEGVHAYRIDRDSGALSATDTLGPGDGLGIAAPAAMEVVAAFGSTWVVLGASVSQSVSVMKLSASGELTPADHLLDTAATRFGGLSALEVVEAAGRVFVLAGGADDGMSMFEMLPGGRLVLVETLAHDTGLGLENVSDIEAQTMDGLVQIFASSASAAGISQFAFALDGLGGVVRPDGAGRGPVTGTGGGDLMLPRAEEATTLAGGGGDDILVSGAGGGVLTGGAGADVFVLAPSEQSLKITDFTPGSDRIDMSAFPMLRSPDQLKARELPDGIELSFGGTSLRVLSQDGGPLELEDLWPGGFSTPDRMPIPAGPSRTLTAGTAKDDTLTGTIGADIMRGRGGSDRLTGAGGNDRLIGGTGHDRASGGAGADRLKGGAGRDGLDGGTGADRLIGGKGRDVLEGGAGRDVLAGGAGADEFRFAAGHGRDRVKDFRPDEDVIRLITDAERFRDLDIADTGGGALIDTGDGTIFLEGVDAKDLKPDDFQLE